MKSLDASLKKRLNTIVVPCQAPQDFMQSEECLPYIESLLDERLTFPIPDGGKTPVVPSWVLFHDVRNGNQIKLPLRTITMRRNMEISSNGLAAELFYPAPPSGECELFVWEQQFRMSDRALCITDMDTGRVLLVSAGYEKLTKKPAIDWYADTRNNARWGNGALDGMLAKLKRDRVIKHHEYDAFHCQHEDEGPFQWNGSFELFRRPNGASFRLAEIHRVEGCGVRLL